MEIEMPILSDSPGAHLHPPGALREVQLYHVEHIDPRRGFKHRCGEVNGIRGIFITIINPENIMGYVYKKWIE